MKCATLSAYDLFSFVFRGEEIFSEFEKMCCWQYYDSIKEWACREREPPTTGINVRLVNKCYDRLTALKMYDEAISIF